MALAVLVLPVAVAVWAAMPQGVSGRVLDTGGRGVEQAQVVATSGFLSSGRALTDPDGRYTLTAGRALPLSDSLSITAPEFAPARTSGGTVVLHRWPRVTGRALDETGSPVPGAVVTLTRGRQVWTATADAEGRFTVVAESGSGPGWLAGQAERHEPAYATAALVLDREVRLVLSMPRLLGTVHLVTDPSGEPPLVDGQPPSDCPQTPCDLALGVGPHHVEFSTDLYVPWAQDVQVDRGTAVGLVARLERKTGTLRVTPPKSGELAVDGRAVDGGGWTGELPTGKHVVSFRSSATWPATAEVDVAWKHTAEARLDPPAVTPGDAGAFVQNLEAYLKAAGGTYGVYLEDLGSGAALGSGQDGRLEAASVIKVPVALYLLHQADAGAVNLEDQVDLHAEDFMSGTGPLFSTAHAGDQYSYQDLLALMIQQSDNTAWRALDRVLGAGNVDAYAASIGARDCRQVDDGCTAREAGQMLSQLARGRLLGPATGQRLLGLLETTVFNDRINYYLGGVAVAHKVGMDGGVINDCGVVYLPGRPFTICVFTTTQDPDLGVQVIRDVARAAARYYGR